MDRVCGAYARRVAPMPILWAAPQGRAEEGPGGGSCAQSRRVPVLHRQGPVSMGTCVALIQGGC